MAAREASEREAQEGGPGAPPAQALAEETSGPAAAAKARRAGSVPPAAPATLPRGADAAARPLPRVRSRLAVGGPAALGQRQQQRQQQEQAQRSPSPEAAEVIDLRGSSSDGEEDEEPEAAEAGKRKRAPAAGKQRPPKRVRGAATGPAAEAAPARGRGRGRAPRGRGGRGRGASGPAGQQAGAGQNDGDTSDSAADVWRVAGDDSESEDGAELLQAPVAPKVLPQLEPPLELLLPLLPYQKEFLGWGIAQERSALHGGILADEMGMGKTIQAISLILTHRTDDPQLTSATGQPAPAAAEHSALRPRPRLQLRGALAARGTHAIYPAGMSEDEQLARALALSLDQQVAVPPPEAGPSGARPQPPQRQLQQAFDPRTGLGSGVHAPDDEAGTSAAAAAAGRCCGGVGGGEGGGGYCGATLVVCPLVAVTQWRLEIEAHTAPGTLRVAVYHGGKRTSDPGVLESADVVLTTYSTLENEYRRTMAPPKVPCSYCGKRFHADRLKLHLRFFCGPYAQKTDRQALQQRKKDRPQQDTRPSSSGALTQMLVPALGPKPAAGCEPRKQRLGAAPPAPTRRRPAATRGGRSGAQRKGGKGSPDASGSDDDPDYDGKESEEEEEESEGESDEGSPAAGRDEEEGSEEELRWEDVVGAAAAADADAARMVAAAEARTTRDPGARSTLHKVRWRRIVLDEAHSIKDRRCSTAKAVFALSSKYKWALSGTPLQNRVGELYSQIRFLRVDPYAFYFCRKCGCKGLDYPFKSGHRKCDHCEHGPLSHYCWWNRCVANPIKRHGYQGKGRTALGMLRDEVLERVLLRRTKLQQADVLALPPRTVVLRKDRFDAREADFYEALYTSTQATFGAYVASGTVAHNFAHIFELLIRLRQAVCHPYLVVHSATAPVAQLAEGGSGYGGEADRGTASSAAGGEGGGVCGICHDPLEDPVVASCSHAFCRLCASEYLESSEGPAACPRCAKRLTLVLAGAAGAGPGAPTAVAAAGAAAAARKGSILNRIDLNRFQSSTKIEALREEVYRMLERDPSAKGIVFSQFTSMLDLCAHRLGACGVRCERLQGGMTMGARDTAIDRFTRDPDVRIFLMSLKAGGVALNLTAASHCFMMDPWWNPAVEQQAMDRVHRLGQYRPMHCVRFVLGGTIEERILKLQEKKQLMFEMTVGRDPGAAMRLTVDDLRFLFG